MCYRLGAWLHKMAIPFSPSKSVVTDELFGRDPGLKQGLLCHGSQGALDPN